MSLPLGQSGSVSTSLIFLALMFVAFYLLLIRPQQKRMRDQRSMQSSLQIGDQIRTLGGFQVTIKRFDEDLITVELSPGVEARIVKQAVASKVSSTAQVDEPPADDPTDNNPTTSNPTDDSVDVTGREEREQK